jgi:Tfp pilus assembly PilM family ATPase
MALNWKRNIDLKKNEILGLDIGSSAVKMVALRKNGAGYSAIAAGITEIAPSEYNDDHHGKNTVAAIRECLERTARFHSKPHRFARSLPKTAPSIIN